MSSGPQGPIFTDKNTRFSTASLPMQVNIAAVVTNLNFRLYLPLKFLSSL